MKIRFVAAIAMLAWATLVMAIDNTPPLADPQLQQRYLGLINELRCMQCQNETLADSNVGLAADLRLEIHQLILAGKTDDQIRDYLVARYGDFILFRPRMNLRNLWLWAAPGIMLIAGIGDRRACDAATRALTDQRRRLAPQSA